MEIPDYYNLVDYSRTLYESNRNGKAYCRVGVSLNSGELIVWRFDFEEWEYNSRTGIVESSYSLDLLNTHQFCSSTPKIFFRCGRQGDEKKLWQSRQLS